MTSELLQEIAYMVGDLTSHIAVVDDPDGLVSTEAVCSQLQEMLGFAVVRAEGIGLRVHYELHIRPQPQSRVCYVRGKETPLLPDLARDARIVKITIADFFPNFADRHTMSSLDFTTLDMLYSKHIQGRVTAQRLQGFLKDEAQCSEPIELDAIDMLRKSLDSPDWTDTDYIETLGKAIKQTIRVRKYNKEVAHLIDEINFDFQHFLQERYFATLNSVGGPKAVHGVAQYLQDYFDSNDKVAFVVVDGMAWWQWEVIREVLEQNKLLPSPEIKAIYAWLPSITALSRQALFRGEAPVLDYRQNPEEEEKLWKRMWKSNPVYAPVYQHNVQSPDELYTATRRLAVVDVQLDKKMHQSSDYYDLYDLTVNWAIKFSKIIERLRREGFRIVLTTDHGNVLAEGRGTLKPDEKVHLYHSNSKGERFVYFNDKVLWRRFRDSHYVRPFFYNPMGTWLAIADNSSFSTNKKQLITHGGSHFMETVIPLIRF